MNELFRVLFRQHETAKFGTKGVYRRQSDACDVIDDMVQTYGNRNVRLAVVRPDHPDYTLLEQVAR